MWAGECKRRRGCSLHDDANTCIASARACTSLLYTTLARAGAQSAHAGGRADCIYCAGHTHSQDFHRSNCCSHFYSVVVLPLLV